MPEAEPERIRTFLAEKLGIKVGPRQEAGAPEASDSPPGEPAAPEGAPPPADAPAKATASEAPTPAA